MCLIVGRDYTDARMLGPLCDDVIRERVGIFADVFINACSDNVIGR